MRGGRGVLRLLAAADPREAFREEEAMGTVVVRGRHPPRCRLLLLFVIRESVGSLAGRFKRIVPPSVRRHRRRAVAAAAREVAKPSAGKDVARAGAADGGEGGGRIVEEEQRRIAETAAEGASESARAAPNRGPGRLGRTRQPLGERHEGGAHLLRVGLIGSLVGLLLLCEDLVLHLRVPRRRPDRVVGDGHARASAGAPSAGGVAGAVAVQHIGDALPFSRQQETAAGTVAPEEARRCSPPPPPPSSGRRGGSSEDGALQVRRPVGIALLAPVGARRPVGKPRPRLVGDRRREPRADLLGRRLARRKQRVDVAGWPRRDHVARDDAVILAVAVERRVVSLESCASSTSEAVSFDRNAFAPYRGGAPAGDFSGECEVARRRLKPRRCPGVDVERCRGRSAGASAAADARCAPSARVRAGLAALHVGRRVVGQDLHRALHAVSWRTLVF